MFDKALALYATMVSTVTSTATASKDEKGQGTLEYVGIVVIAALLVTAIVTAVQGADIGSTITSKIAEITGAG